jgi:hypothetical protein
MSSRLIRVKTLGIQKKKKNIESCKKKQDSLGIGTSDRGEGKRRE